MSLIPPFLQFAFFFFFNDTATTEIYTLSLHDALPISLPGAGIGAVLLLMAFGFDLSVIAIVEKNRSEEHTSELQSQSNLVCRLLLEKKKKVSNLTTFERYHSTTDRSRSLRLT